MSVTKNDIIKLRPSVAVVAHLNLTEFFLTNIRKSVNLEMNKDVSKLLFQFNGNISITEWMANNQITKSEEASCLALLNYLVESHILIKVDTLYGNDYDTYPRLFTLLEDYSTSQSQVINKFEKFRNSHVMIIGLGSVGTWIAQCLVMNGIKTLTIVDNDDVELSNLHRQIGFSLDSVGENKIKTFEKHLKEINNSVKIICIKDILNIGFFDRNKIKGIDLIINCADYPSVDETSHIIGEYSMEKGIPHIIGGGYNLHQSLIGQVVIPGKTACMECFKMNLEEKNEIDTSNITKLNRVGRKVGSFPPLSVLSASISANEAFKLLAGIDDALVMTNTRTEFSLRNLNFSNIQMNRRKDCKWCGEHGKYYHL